MNRRNGIFVLVVRIAVTIAAAEALIMVVLDFLVPPGSWLGVLLDPTLLVLITTPAIYLLVVRPLKHAQLTVAAIRAKSEFLANMSHEIRTPMTAILGYADILADDLEHPEHLEAVNTIRRNGDHLLAIINDILDLSKIEAGKFQVERIACSPAAVLADVVSLMRVRADVEGLALKLEFAGPCPETVLTDPTRLRQILINVVGNAIKFTEAGEVRIIARLIDHDTPKPMLACEVVDTGIGMTPQQVENLFQPFQQADGASNRKFGGTGLGLAISKRLAKLLGGDIRASSEPGKGSRFTLTIDTGPLSGVAMLDRPWLSQR